GRDIYFAEGKSDPASSSGQALLSHELTHVLQQTKRGRLPVQPLRRGRSLTGLEAEAKDVSRVLSSRRGGDTSELVVEQFRSSYAMNRPATDVERARLEAISVEALKTCGEILRTNHPDVLQDARTLESVAVDVDISLARAGDLEAGRAWGRRLAEAVVT